MSGQLKVTGNILAAQKLQQVFAENLLKKSDQPDEADDKNVDDEADKALLDVSDDLEFSHAFNLPVLHLVVGAHLGTEVRFGLYLAAQPHARRARLYSPHPRFVPVQHNPQWQICGHLE